MKVLLYSAREEEAALPIMKWAQSILSPEHFEICRSLQELEIGLRRQSTRCQLAILHISAVQEMDRLILLKNLLDDIRIILIVPDVTRDTIQKGHRLYPRFMTDANIDMNKLAAVIQKNLACLNIDPSTIGYEKCCVLPPLTKRKK
jgi:hypothetical protein